MPLTEPAPTPRVLEVKLMSGDGNFTAKIAYAILAFGACVLALRAYDWYYEWPW